MSYDCIIFDCDGVLVDSEEISNRVLLDMLKPLGLEVDEQYALMNFSGTSLKSIFQTISHLTQKDLPSSFEQEYRRRTYELFKTNLLPVNGILEVLQSVNIPICVASSGPLTKIEQNLKTTKLYKFFKGNIFSSYEIGSWKPSPKIFLYAAEKMDCAPSRCLVIEDSLAGIQAARNGKFDVIGYTSEKNRTRFEAASAKVITQMKELKQILKTHQLINP